MGFLYGRCKQVLAGDLNNAHKWRTYRDHRFCEFISPYVGYWAFAGCRSGAQWWACKLRCILPSYRKSRAAAAAADQPTIAEKTTRIHDVQRLWCRTTGVCTVVAMLSSATNCIATAASDDDADDDGAVYSAYVYRPGDAVIELSSGRLLCVCCYWQQQQQQQPCGAARSRLVAVSAAVAVEMSPHCHQLQTAPTNKPAYNVLRFLLGIS